MTLRVIVGYPAWDHIEGLIGSLGGSVEAEFGADVTVAITLPEVAVPRLREQLADLGVTPSDP